MDKLKMETPDLTQSNIEKIAALFPSCVTEARGEDGKLKKAVNFELLRQMLSDVILEGDEAYEFTWVGKKAAIVEANKSIRKTLRPVKENETVPTGADSTGKPYCSSGSISWDSTENLYIEGDNLEVLKLLQGSYLGKVKMIYIDPPYNTGNDFIYRDDFAMSSEEYSEESGQVDEDGNRLFRNTDSNGRFHSDWCSMIYSRLLLARNLLTDDGVIFISISDREVDNLKKLCNEVFGEENFIGTILWKKKVNGNNMGIIPTVHDYIVAYARAVEDISEIGYAITEEHINKTYSNPDNDPRGAWTTMDLSANHKGPYFAITNPLNGEVFYPPEGRYWVFNEEEVKRRIADGRIIFGKTGITRPVQKVFAQERIKGKIRAESWWDKHGMNEDATTEIRELFGQGKLFTHPKPSKLLYNLVKISTSDNDIIFDFFSGSATTAHAVMRLNAEDGGNRKFIMVQLPEPCDEKSEAYKAGYKNICEIGKERIRRAAKTIAADNPCKPFDGGFRVFKLDESNMEDVYYAAGDYSQSTVENYIDNIKEGRSGLDLLSGCLLEWGAELSKPHTCEKIDGFEVHTYNDGELIACFDDNITDGVVKEIAKRQPLRAVFKDGSFDRSPSKINVTEIFKLFAPNTTVKVL